MFVFRKYGVRVGIVYFDEEPEGTKIDICRFHVRSAPVDGSDYFEFYTLLLDLRMSPEELMAAMDRSTAYEIRRAHDKDQLSCSYPDPKAESARKEFLNFYDRFCETTNLAPLDVPGRRRLDAWAEEGKLDIAVVNSREDEPLSYHVYYRTRERAMLFYSCAMQKLAPDAAKRALIGRANRLLFWSDFLRFKEMGLTTYDFGGWYAGKEGTHLLSINHFKEGFGGRVVRTYKCEMGMTLKGRLALWLRRKLRAKGK